ALIPRAPAGARMAKEKAVYVCNACGAQSAKWVGQCPACTAWNTLTETVVASTRGVRLLTGASPVPQALAQIEPEKIARLQTGIGELDRVLGGGLVAGSVVLLGGDPGIGKSTLLIQALARIGRSARVLYVSGE